MPIDARILLGGRPTNISGNFMRGQQQKNRNALTDLALKRDEREATMLEDNKAAMQAQAEAEALEKANFENLQSIAAGAKAVKPMLDDIGSAGTALEFLDSRIANIEARGGDASDTKELRDTIHSGRIDLARAMIDETLSVAEANKALLPEKVNGDGTIAAIAERDRLLEDAKSDDPTVRDSALIKLGTMARAGSSAQERILSDPELSGAAVELEGNKAGAKTQATGEAKRVQAVIDQGREVADGAPILRRGLELLNRVQTGGVLNEAQLAFAKRLGVETADQGELSANLGKAVLSQLRETFGAQFTEQEGQRLENLEAGFGKNNATNQRLLNQALEIVEFKAKRAAQLARDNGDIVTAQLIDDALKFEITGGEQASSGQPAAVDMSDDDLKKQLGL